MSGVLRVALYPRVSTEEQVIKGYSLEAQEEALITYAKEKNYKVIGIYRDEGFSARKPAMKRKVMQELLADVKAGKIDRILFIKLDRWFRNVREYHKVQSILDEHNVTWEATMEDYNTSTADGRLKVNIMLSVAENESDRTSERIKFVFEAKRRRKEYCFTGKTKPFGYTAEVIEGVKRCVKDPQTEHIVNDFWDYVLKYNSIRKAGMYCNEKYGITRNYRTWMQMSNNELYTGTYRGVEEYCPAYISRKDWEYVTQSHVMIKKTQKPDRIYLFTGLLRCPDCGNTLKGTFKTYPSDRSKEYLSYRCNNGRLKMCPYRGTLSEKKLEKYLLENTRQELQQFVLSVDVQEQKKKAQPRLHNIIALSEQLRRLNVIYIAGNISDEEYSSESKRLRSEIETARNAEAEAAPINIEHLKSFLLTDFEGIYESLSKEDKRRMWRSVIEAIQIEHNSVKSIKFRT